ncbi:MAG: serine acetyltransferase [Dysgonamonadaceae bacterium]|jgi:serine O-acetyltransferase|nr:serine acetyltransferase [Dysgonamonadaceae bacterium]
MKTYSFIEKTVNALSGNHSGDYPSIPLHERRMPSAEIMNEIIELIRSALFPGYFGSPLVNEVSLTYHNGVEIEKIYNLLFQQIYDSLFYHNRSANADSEQIRKEARRLAQQFIERLPEIKKMLSTDVKAIFDSDPAAKSYGEVIFCYPAARAITNYRIAHELYKLQIPLLPRIITELAHGQTGIDIHPGAQIGRYFSIDHGTGVVIGETTIIGEHVTLYQGVTLGAKNITLNLDADGQHLNTPRHPILEDNVTVYSNSSILGRITIGHGTIIGGNIWLTYSVPPNSRILQTRAVSLDLTDGAGI